MQNDKSNKQDKRQEPPFIYQGILDEFDEYLSSHTKEEIIQDIKDLQKGDSEFSQARSQENSLNKKS